MIPEMPSNIARTDTTTTRDRLTANYPLHPQCVRSASGQENRTHDSQTRTLRRHQPLALLKTA